MVKRRVLTQDHFKIPGQLGFRAVQILIKVQEWVSEDGPYNYVEIGSFRGRSLLPHVWDDDCEHALSIDLRPSFTPDERSPIDYYDEVSAESMMAAIARHVPKKNLKKVECLTADAREIGSRKGTAKFDLALIDGEHTNEAAFSDFIHLLPEMKDECVVIFDDTHIVFSAVANAITLLESQGRPHKALFMKGSLTILLIGDKFVDRAKVPIAPRLFSSREEQAALYRETLIKAHLTDYAAEFAAKDEDVRAALEAAIHTPPQG